MTIDDWYTWATADAEARGLPALKPLLDALRTATRELRDGDWNDDAAGPQEPASETPAQETPAQEKPAQEKSAL